MTLSHLYQKPLCLEPLDADPDKNGQKSDHRVVISKPISIVNNKCSRLTRTVKVRSFPQSGISKMGRWKYGEDLIIADVQKNGILGSWIPRNIYQNHLSEEHLR
jgi:hypothetical protein